MFGIMLQKMWHKKWMNICLLLGCILLIATVVSFPIYRSAAYDRMLNDEFKSYISSEGKWPTLIKAGAVSKKDANGETIKKMESFASSIYRDLEVNEKYTYQHYYILATAMSSDMKRQEVKETQIKLSAIDNIDKYSNIIVGEGLSDTGLTKDGAIEVIVSQSCLVDKKLLVGETFTFDLLKDINGKPIKVFIKGVFDSSKEDSYFWQATPESFNDSIFMKMDLFREMFTGENARKYQINVSYVAMFDYEQLKASDVERILEKTDYYTKESSFRSVIKEPDYPGIIETYNRKLSRISTTLVILQVPVLVMLAAFLFMISGQMYEMEKNEISVIKSRGSSSGQIIRLYLYQGLVITLLGAAGGLPLGAFFARMLGSTRNFLEFNFNSTLTVSYTKETFVYALIAVLICLLSIAIPSLKHSRVSIVNLKQSKAIKKKSLWEKLFIDVILLGVSLYGFYNFNKNMNSVSTSVLSGESLDPLLYISSSLFIVGAGLFFLRIQPYVIKFIYILGKNQWKPAAYVSFMENIKNGRKQQLIMLFLIMTISLGMYHSTVARSILDNAIENTEYLDGTDVIMQEIWTQMVDDYGNYTGEYIVPEFKRFAEAEFADSVTKVYKEDAAYILADKKERVYATVMGIHTKEFGTITMVEKNLLNNRHYYEYLNDLAVAENGVLISSNLAVKQGYSVGDSITYYNAKSKKITGKVVGIIDYFPGFIPESNTISSDGTAFTQENYLIVSHYDYLVSKWGITPYEIWFKLKAGYTAKDVYDFVNSQKISLKKYVNRNVDVESTMNDPLLQGTNGILTMGFVVTILLCGVGYLIYWIMSIRDRELIFGVLRATGFHKGEIFHVLINEQIFSGVFSVFAGIGIGKLTSMLFVPILQNAYASENQALPMKLITVSSDLYRLYIVIAGVMVLALAVLVVLLFKMNVTKALKLGEE